MNETSEHGGAYTPMGGHAWAAADTRLRRIHDVIHAVPCPVLRRYPSLPWKWAEGRSDAYVQQQMARNGLRACKRCEPFASDDYPASTERGA